MPNDNGANLVKVWTAASASRAREPYALLTRPPPSAPSAASFPPPGLSGGLFVSHFDRGMGWKMSSSDDGSEYHERDGHTESTQTSMASWTMGGMVFLFAALVFVQLFYINRRKASLRLQKARFEDSLRVHLDETTRIVEAVARDE